MSTIKYRVTLPEAEIVEGLNAAKRRPKGFYKQVSILDPATGRELLCARFYQSGSVCYCNTWIRSLDGNRHMSGSGRAGGHGYHKASAAFADALGKAGVLVEYSSTLETKGGWMPGGVDGRGDSVITAVAHLIGRKVSGKRKLICHTAVE